LRIYNTEKIADEVLRHELNIGFVGGMIHDSTKIAVEPFASDEIVLIASPRHRLSGKKIIRPVDLRDEEFIVREKGSATWIAAEACLQQLGINPKVRMKLGGSESVKRAVSAGSSLGLLSRSAIQDEEKLGQLVVLPMPEFRCCRQLNLIYRKGKHLTSTEKAFLAFVRSQLTAAPVLNTIRKHRHRETQAEKKQDRY
jgi:DNA-binding transcriptional LysR family regulator